MSPSILFKGAIFPAVVGGTLYGLHAILCAGVAPALALFATSAASLLAVALFEIVAPYRKDWAWWRDRQSVNDLVHGVLASLAGPRLADTLLTSLAAAGAASLAAQTDGPWPTGWPLPGQLILAVLLADFVEWIKHWGYHHLVWAWPIHALHHDIDRMHVMKGARLHFLETAVRFTIVTAPLLALGAGPEVVIWYGAMLNVLGMLNHSNIDLPLPAFAHYLIQTPQVHRLHHAMDHRLGTSNLSAISMMPDLLFGTFRHPDRNELGAVGAFDSPIGSRLLTQVAAPFLWPVLTSRGKADR